MSHNALSSQSSHNEVQKPAFRLRSLLSLHRRVGIVSALFVLLLSLTGLVLQHSPALGLDQRFIGSGTARVFYGIEAPEISVSYAVGEARATLIGDAVYFNETRLPGGFSRLSGMVANGSGYAIALADQLLLVTSGGELVEALGSTIGVPDGIDAVGTAGGTTLYLDQAGTIIEADTGALAFTPAPAPPPALQWSLPSDPDEPAARRMRDHYASSLLSWERIILDLHSGRLLGGFGVILVDVMALLFLFMAATGVWIWSGRRSSR